MNQARNVVALFTEGGMYPLTVTKTGAGTITSSPVGVDCGSDCSETYPSGTQVTLNIAAETGWAMTDFHIARDCSRDEQICELRFLSSGDSGAPITVFSCPLEMNEAKTVRVGFSPL